MELKGVFFIIQILLILAFVAAWRWMRSSSDGGSQFKEGDSTPRQPRLVRGEDPLAQSRRSGRGTKKSAPLQLGGIVIHGQPHEVLGISSSATEAEITQAYRGLMKRFHPDKLGPPGSAAWRDGQEIADAINRAKVEMLQRRRQPH